MVGTFRFIYLNNMSEKSSKYIDVFLRGESLQRSPLEDLEKMVFRVHPG